VAAEVVATMVKKMERSNAAFWFFCFVLFLIFYYLVIDFKILAIKFIFATCLQYMTKKGRKWAKGKGA
jgi:hypothetical protein